MTPKDPVREALPARPMVIGNDRKARPQIWFKWPEVQAYARAAVAALPVQSAEPVAWLYESDTSVEPLIFRNRLPSYDADYKGDRLTEWPLIRAYSPSPASAGDVEKDAARYREWKRAFREGECGLWNALCECNSDSEHDAAIDAALRSQPMGRGE